MSAKPKPRGNSKSTCGKCGRRVSVVYEVSVGGVILAGGMKVCLACADQVTAEYRDGAEQ